MNTGGRKNNASENGRTGRNDRADGTDTEEHRRHGTENRQSGQSIKSNQIRSTQENMGMNQTYQTEMNNKQNMQKYTARTKT